MSKIKIEQEVSKEAYELASGLSNAVDHVKSALADGWQPGKDLPVVMQAVLMDIVPAVQGVDQMSAEMAEDEEAFVTAFLLPFKSLAFSLLKKKKEQIKLANEAKPAETVAQAAPAVEAPVQA